MRPLDKKSPAFGGNRSKGINNTCNIPNTNDNSSRNQGKSGGQPPFFDRSRLPSPAEYLSGQGLKLTSVRGNQGMMVCPFHPDRTPSLSVNMASGAFFCFGCGAKGGGVVDFHMLLKSLTFKEAVADLTGGNHG